MKKLLLVFQILLITGCAAGNKYSYRSSPMALPVKPDENKVLVLLVEDLRPYVISGNKAANFVGLQRGGFGNPFDVTTTSGKPMTEDMSAAITGGLKKAGYSVIDVHGNPEMGFLINTANDAGASRIAILQVNDWKSDIFASITLHCDLDLSIYQDNGKLLAENSITFVEAISGAQMGANKNAEIVTDEFSKQIGYLFNEESIRNALR